MASYGVPSDVVDDEGEVNEGGEPAAKRQHVQYGEEEEDEVEYYDYVREPD